MNTEKLAKDDTLKYQFLCLDRPQNLSVASLNQLLKGKGVLENQVKHSVKLLLLQVSMKFT